MIWIVQQILGKAALTRKLFCCEISLLCNLIRYLLFLLKGKAYDFSQIDSDLVSLPADPTPQFLNDLLELACRYDIADAKRWAISEFEQLGTAYDPCHCLNMAIQYHIDCWVEPSFRALLHPSLHLDELSDEQLGYLDGFPYTHVVNTRSKLDQFRLRLMWYEPLYQHYLLCTTPGRCQIAWNSQW